MKEKVRNKNSVTVLTLGCSKNVVDSEILIGLLEANNFEINHEIEKSDILIINTCGFIKPAKEESLGVILDACELRKQKAIRKLIVCGCLSERYPEELKAQIKYVDNFFGLNSSQDILRAISESVDYCLQSERHLLTPPHYAYIKISEGCSHQCSFCAIPMIRGKYSSRPKDEIIHEVKKLVERGVREFNIIAQDTTYYGLDLYRKRMLAPLLREMSEIDGVEWIRLLYTYPVGFPFDVLDVMAEKENICNYIDIPLQHVSGGILKSMKRGMSMDSIGQLIEKIRQKLPGIAVRTTFLVGYPGETDEDFDELLYFVKKMEFDRLGVFTYSHEEGTSAYKLKDSVPEQVKEERRDEIMKAQMDISLMKNQSKVGKNIKFIIDDADNSTYIGRTEHDAPDIDNGVYVSSDSPLQPGDFVLAKVTKADVYDLFANKIAVI